MRGAASDNSFEDLVNSVIERHRVEILDSCEDSLARSGATYADESPPGPEVRAQAAAVLDEVQRRLRDPYTDALPDAEAPNAAFGSAFAQRALHPSKSRRAAQLLFDAILSGIVTRLPAGCDPRAGVARVASAVHSVVMEGLTAAAVSYMTHLLERLHRSHADERRRVARELHDMVAHSVALGLQNLELFALYRDNDPQRATTQLDKAFRQLREATDIVRSLAQDLRTSGAVEGLGLALGAYMNSVPNGGEIEVYFTGDEAYLPDAIRGELFLVLREGLRNAAAHANAKSIRVEVDITPGQVRASVVDDGVGFDVTAEESGTGLASMRERVALLGGRIFVASAPGKGTSIHVEVPLVGVDDG